MSRIPRPLVSATLLGAVTLGFASASHAGLINANASPNALVTDGSDSGLVSVIHVPGPVSGEIEDVNVTLNLVGEPGGGWNGDLYVYIAHAGVLSVLVNRPGVSSSNSFGYGDNGLAQVTFDDTAPLGDFHLYQEGLGVGDTDLPITGIFQPDGRLTDPSHVLPSDTRSAMLGMFDGEDASGEWRLFVADLSPGGSFRLASWGLSITTADPLIVPESRFGLVGATVATLFLALGQRFVRRRAV